MGDDAKSKDLPDEERDGTEVPGHTVRVQQLFVKHQTSLKAFILSLQPDFTEAEDILQEVFLVVTRKAADFQEGTNFLAWAFSIARFKVLESARRRKAAGQALSAEVIENLCTSLPEDGFFEARAAAVRACLEKLAPRMQDVMRLRYFAEHGPGEIARLLSWTTNSVNVALSKARKFIYDCVHRELKGV